MCAPAKSCFSLPGHLEEVTSVTFSPDGVQLASSSHAGVKIWDSQGPASMAVARERRHLWRADKPPRSGSPPLVQRRFHLDQMLHTIRRIPFGWSSAAGFCRAGIVGQSAGGFRPGRRTNRAEPWLLSQLALIQLAKNDQLASHGPEISCCKDLAQAKDAKAARAIVCLAILMPVPERFTPRCAS